MIRAATYVGIGLVIGVGIAAAIFGLSPSALTPGLVLPSGQRVTPYQVLWEPHEEIGETWMVLRFLAPRVARDGGDITYDRAEADFAALCTRIGQPLATLTGGADQIIIALIDRPFPRGEPAPEATSLLNAFRLDGGACQWE